MNSDQGILPFTRSQLFKSELSLDQTVNILSLETWNISGIHTSLLSSPLTKHLNRSEKPAFSRPGQHQKCRFHQVSKYEVYCSLFPIPVTIVTSRWCAGWGIAGRDLSGGKEAPIRSFSPSKGERLDGETEPVRKQHKQTTNKQLCLSCWFILNMLLFHC